MRKKDEWERCWVGAKGVGNKTKEGPTNSGDEAKLFLSKVVFKLGKLGLVPVLHEKRKKRRGEKREK